MCFSNDEIKEDIREISMKLSLIVRDIEKQKEDIQYLKEYDEKIKNEINNLNVNLIDRVSSVESFTKVNNSIVKIMFMVIFYLIFSI